jgi:hypothetical protein
MEREIQNSEEKFELEIQVWMSSAYKLQVDNMGIKGSVNLYIYIYVIIRLPVEVS